MMDRRTFLRRSALIAAGIIAADQLDVLEMLAPRRLFAGFSAAVEPRFSYVTISELSALYKKTQSGVLVVMQRVTEEAKWFSQFPESIALSGNEMRIPLQLGNTF